MLISKGSPSQVVEQSDDHNGGWWRPQVDESCAHNSEKKKNKNKRDQGKGITW